MGHHLLAVLYPCVAATALTAQGDPALALIERLAVPAQRNDASRELLRLGAATAAPLAARLATATGDHARACLAVLTELGPAGGAAVPALVEWLRALDKQQRAGCVLEALSTLAELIPYREQDLDFNGDRQLRYFLSGQAEPPDIQAYMLASQRLRERSAFPRHQGVDALIVLAQDRRPWYVEAAIERLGALGPAAARAVPILRAVLQHPEPRVLPSDQRVPLHRRAARALLAIAPDGGDAETARRVLAGTWSPPAAAHATPERARQRIEQLLTELAAADGARRRDASANLVALGAVAAEPVAALLTTAHDDATIAAALEVLQGLGKHGTPAVPALATALAELSATHTIAVMKALAATLPWSEHVYLTPAYSCRINRFEIQGRPITGTIDVAFVNAFGEAYREFSTALAIPVDSPLETLRALLDDPVVPRRRRTLEVIAARGSQCAPLLEPLAAMLDTRQPPEQQTQWTDRNRLTTRMVDRTDEIQRLAAAAILAIASADHPLVDIARERLEHPEVK